MVNRVFVYGEQKITQDYHKTRPSAHIELPISVTKAQEHLSTEDKQSCRAKSLNK